MIISYNNINLENLSVNRENYIIPVETIKDLLNGLKKATSHRIAITLLVLTGARVTEICRLKTDDFYQNYVFIRLGKNQKGIRKVVLPDWFLIELDQYINNHNFIGRKLFPFNANGLNRYFNNIIRKQVKGEWLKKTVYTKGNIKGYEWYYQLKGFRHTYQSLKFVNLYDKYKDAGLSAEMVSADMKHHSRALSVRHYIRDLDELQRYKHNSINDLIKDNNQKSLIEFI